MIGLQENRVALGEIDHQNMDLPPDAAQHRPRFAEICLSVTRRVRKRNEDLLQRKPTRPDVVPHRRVTAVEPALVAQPFEQPWIVCRCFFGSVRSDFRISSMNAACASSFGRTRCFPCRYPGGTECPTIFATVPRSIPNRRAASRPLKPSRSTAMRTFEYSSTPYILPPPDHHGDPETCHWRDSTPPQPGQSGRSRGRLCRRRSQISVRSIIRSPSLGRRSERSRRSVRAVAAAPRGS